MDNMIQITMQDSFGARSTLHVPMSAGEIPTEELMKAALEPFSYAKLRGTAFKVQAALSTLTTIDTTPVGRGIACKAIIIMKDADGNLYRFSIPAPKVNVAGGINVQSDTSGRDYIPAADQTTPVACKGGDSITASYAAMVDRAGMVFVSGSLVKIERSK